MPGRWKNENCFLIENPGGKGFFWIVECLIFVLVFLIGTGLESVPVTVGTLVWVIFSDVSFAKMGNGMALQMENLPDWLMLVELFSTALMTGLVFLFCWLLQKRSPARLGFVRRNWWKNYLTGMVFGLVLLATSVGICCLLGEMTLTAQPFSIGTLVLFFFGFLVQGMSEEVLCRGYFMLSVARKNSLLAAILTNSVFFGLLHVFNPGVTPLAIFNIVLFGVLESVLVLRKGEIWTACGIHSLWNFAQGNLFGIPVSGSHVSCSPLVATVKSGEKLISGGDFGVEGGLCVTVVILIGILAILFLPKTSKKNG